MPVINLSDEKTRNETPPSYPVWAKVKKGDEKPERGPGRNLNYFRFDWIDENAEKVFNQIFPDELQSIFIKTLAHDVDSAFDSYYRKYSSNNVLQIKCDGCTIVKALNRDLPGQDCICDKDDNGLTVKSAKTCGLSGYLYFTIQEMVDAMGYQGQFILRTGSPEEVQKISSVLQATFNKIGTLVDAPFLLQRNERKYDTTKDDGTPVQYTQWDVELVPPSDKILRDHYGLATKAYLNNTTMPQLESSVPALSAPDETIIENDNEQDPQLGIEQASFETYVTTVTELADRYLGLTLDGFLFQYGPIATIEELYNQVPDLAQLKDAITQWIVDNDKPVRVYGCRTRQSGKTKLMDIPYGFGTVIMGSRKGFGETLKEHAYGSYTNEQGNEVDLATDGLHAFKDVFKVDYLTMTLELTKGDKLKIKTVNDDIPF